MFVWFQGGSCPEESLIFFRSDSDSRQLMELINIERQMLFLLMLKLNRRNISKISTKYDCGFQVRVKERR